MDWAAYPDLRHRDGGPELLARNEYLATENRIPKDHLKGRLMLSDAERARLGEIGHCLGRKVLAEVTTVAGPDTILAWYRNLVARKFSGLQARQGPGRPRLKREVEQLIRGRTTSCCFLVTRRRDEAGLCNVAKGWAGYCIIIIKKPRNLAEKSRTCNWRSIAPVQGQLRCWQTPRCHRTLLARRAVEPRRDGQQSTRFNFLQSKPWINISIF
jgi:hypothetical protein